MLRIKLFGSARVWDGDREIPLPSSANTIPLLAYLLMHRGEAIPRKRVAFTVWADQPEEAALQSLRRNLHRLVKALPDAPFAWTVGSGHNIGWNTGADVWFDVAQFERLRAAEATLEDAVALVGGDFLSERYDDWIVAERERLRRAYLADLASLVSTNRSRRASDKAVRFARQLLDEEPWREDALRSLMSARYEAGDAAGALADFDDFARRLRSEMNADPMPETVALRSAISRSEKLPSELGTVRINSAARTHPTPFIGRENELHRLRKQWLAASRGNGALTVLRGEAGIGKSRLASELALIVGAEGGRVVVGTTSSPERNPYECLVTALGSAIQLLAAVELPIALLSVLADLLPELRTNRDRIPPVVQLDPASDTARLYEALSKGFAGLAGPRPLLIILEDIHRAGEATIAALASLAQHLPRLPILVVATFRPAEVDRSHPLRSLLRAGDCEVLALGPLRDLEVRELIDKIAEHDALPSEIRTSVVDRSDGNPLFVTELLRDASRFAETGFAVPESIKAIIDGRVASLASSGRAVAEISATVGEAFSVELVRELAGLREAELLDGLDELLDRHLLRESIERGRFDYAFSHHLVHAIVYDAIPADVRKRRHRRIARILDSTSASNGDGAAAIAFHWERGGDVINAARHYARAAHRAARLNANTEARAFADRALELGVADDTSRFELIHLRARINARIGDAAAEANDLDEMEGIAQRLGADEVCATLVRRIDRAFRDADPAAESAAIERLYKEASAVDSTQWLAAASEARAKREQRAGEYERSIDNALAARAHYADANNVAAVARVTAFVAFTSSHIPERSRDAQRLANEAVEIAERAGEADVHIAALRHAAYLARDVSGDFDRSASLLRAALKLSLEIGDRGLEALCRLNLGSTLRKTWQVDEALQQLRTAVELCESLGIAPRLRAAMSGLAIMLGDIGDYSAAVDLCYRSAQMSIEAKSSPNAVLNYCNIADIAWQRGDIEELRRSIGSATSFADAVPTSRTRSHLLLNTARLLRCDKKFDSALSALEESLDEHERSARAESVNEVLEEIALTHLGRSDIDAARSAFNRTVAGGGEQHDNVAYPIRHFWIDACISRAQHRESHARIALERAHAFYSMRSSSIEAKHLRTLFAAIPVHAAISGARTHDIWPDDDAPCVIAFPTPRDATAVSSK